MKELTKAEEQVMQILWKIEKGFIKDILDHFNEPKPAYTTVATVVKILKDKGFVDYKAYGNAYQFFPQIAKEEYAKKHVNKVLKKYFKGSVSDMVSFFTENNTISLNDIDDAMRVLSEIKKTKE